eukprot:bmy_18327T0
MLGKFSSLLTHNENMVTKVDEVKSMIKFQMKEVLYLTEAVAHVKMTDDELVYNIHLAVNFLVSLLKKNWQNHMTLADVKAIFTELQKEVCLLLLTNGERQTQREIEACACLSYFDAIVVDGEQKEEKPAPSIFYYSCDLLGVQPGDCVMVHKRFEGLVCLAVDEYKPRGTRSHFPSVATSEGNCLVDSQLRKAILRTGLGINKSDQRTGFPAIEKLPPTVCSIGQASTSTTSVSSSSGYSVNTFFTFMKLKVMFNIKNPKFNPKSSAQERPFKHRKRSQEGHGSREEGYILVWRHETEYEEGRQAFRKEVIPRKQVKYKARRLADKQSGSPALKAALIGMDLIVFDEKKEPFGFSLKKYCINYHYFKGPIYFQVPRIMVRSCDTEGTDQLSLINGRMGIQQKQLNTAKAVSSDSHIEISQCTENQNNFLFERLLRCNTDSTVEGLIVIIWKTVEKLELQQMGLSNAEKEMKLTQESCYGLNCAPLSSNQTCLTAANVIFLQPHFPGLQIAVAAWMVPAEN